jgi:hypothetical protein
MKENVNEKNTMEEIKEVEEAEKLSNEDAIDIQMNYLKSPLKNILYSLIANEPEIEENKNIDKGIYLYLKNVYNKYYCNEIKYILGSINSQISYINDKNKKQKQNKEFYDREINTITSEKIEYFNKKETLDKELELLTLNKMQNSICKTERSDPYSPINTNNNEIDNTEINEKNKKIEELRKKYDKILANINNNKKEFDIIKNKNNLINEENMLLNEKYKQKQLIYDQIRRENEKNKTMIIKRGSIKPSEKKGESNKTVKTNKTGSFLKNMFSKKK